MTATFTVYTYFDVHYAKAEISKVLVEILPSVREVFLFLPCNLSKTDNGIILYVTQIMYIIL